MAEEEERASARVRKMVKSRNRFIGTSLLTENCSPARGAMQDVSRA
jgi:hypothetical protein